MFSDYGPASPKASQPTKLTTDTRNLSNKCPATPSIHTKTSTFRSDEHQQVGHNDDFAVRDKIDKNDKEYVEQSNTPSPRQKQIRSTQGNFKFDLSDETQTRNTVSENSNKGKDSVEEDQECSFVEYSKDVRKDNEFMDPKQNHMTHTGHQLQQGIVEQTSVYQQQVRK